ncbi:MAG: ATP-binding cassette domain-containing protein [Bryobacterales bacterium]|nr:ATP-binding cassette domain-containing protein [Bryobacterales bacterium]
MRHAEAAGSLRSWGVGNSNALIDFRNVSVMRGERVVLDRLSLRIETGEHVAILGPNGCGKSTLVKTITRDLYPLRREGMSAQILGRDRWHLFDLRHQLGVVSHDLANICHRPIKGLETVLSGYYGSIGLMMSQAPSAEMRAKAEALMEEFAISHLKERWLDELSSGEARRILIARALVHEPKALLFDEPSTSLDLAAQRELVMVLRGLSRRGVSLVLVTHHLADIIPEIERVILMRSGRVIADGSKGEVLTASTLRTLFGTPVELVCRDEFFHAWWC